MWLLVVAAAAVAIKNADICSFYNSINLRNALLLPVNPANLRLAFNAIFVFASARFLYTIYFDSVARRNDSESCKPMTV